ncbi:MAG: DUF2218 domain-containing protein [Intrasporangium sp.]|nr:DUF2218 domain-containing protein [Intrasporangium sp.]MDN5797793.1 DUF2218 domain-containing protein [Intrasporangium sp.]
MSPTPPAVHESRADVATGKPARYAKQLASHLGRKVPAEPTETGHRITIAGGVCELEVHEDTSLLVLLASAPDAESLTRVQDVVGRHLVGFGARDGLVVEWSSGHRHDPA